MSNTILVTGGSGFVGTTVCKLLVEQGHNVINIDHKKKEIPGVTQYPFDIDNHQVEGIIKLTQPDTIIHLAGTNRVGPSVKNPSTYYKNNVANTINLLDCAVDSGVKNFVFSSSSTVYGNCKQLPMHEGMPMAPVSPYGRTKAIVEEIMRDYETAYDIKCVSLRYFNAAGAMPDNSHGYTQDPASHLVPIVARKLAKGETVTVYGNDYDTADGTCERDYTHVCDVAQAHIDAITRLEQPGTEGGVFNIGASSPASVLDVIKEFESVTGQTVSYEIAERRAGDAAKTYADTNLAKDSLGWEPQYTLNDIVQHAWAWETKKRKKK